MSVGCDISFVKSTTYRSCFKFCEATINSTNSQGEAPEHTNSVTVKIQQKATKWHFVAFDCFSDFSSKKAERLLVPASQMSGFNAFLCHI
ncbi:MAG: hypothetical protein ACRC41_05200, partial [Sarcina sp.]